MTEITGEKFSETAGGLLNLGNNVYVEFAYLTLNVRSNYLGLKM